MDTLSPPVSPPLSFKERLAARRRELEAESSFVLPVPGYPALFARYRILGFHDMRDIGERVEQEGLDTSEGERASAAETLIAACEGLLEQRDSGEFVEMNCRWTTNTAREVFGVDLPEGASARNAIYAIWPYPRDMLMMSHFQAYAEYGMSDILPRIEDQLVGESRASSDEI